MSFAFVKVPVLEELTRRRGFASWRSPLGHEQAEALLAIVDS
jgi:hypothetical protein